MTKVKIPILDLGRHSAYSLLVCIIFNLPLFNLEKSRYKRKKIFKEIKEFINHFKFIRSFQEINYKELIVNLSFTSNVLT